MSKCECQLCVRHNRWRDSIFSGTEAEKQDAFSEMLDLILDLEMDRDYNAAVWSGEMGADIMRLRAAKLLSIADNIQSQQVGDE